MSLSLRGGHFANFDTLLCLVEIYQNRITLPNQRSFYNSSMTYMSIKNMTLLVGKKLEIFKKHRQAEFQILTCKNCFG